jgi:hypothetical protein
MDNFRWGRFLAVKLGGLFDPSGEGYPPLRIRKEDFRGIGAEEGSPSFLLATACNQKLYSESPNNQCGLWSLLSWMLARRDVHQNTSNGQNVSQMLASASRRSRARVFQWVHRSEATLEAGAEGYIAYIVQAA